VVDYSVVTNIYFPHIILITSINSIQYILFYVTFVILTKSDLCF
jgi:hypothetical protein